jgi:UDP-glucose 6-dehydrogenase
LLASAELAKYAANCFLATKLSYVNTLAELCEALSADITDLTHVLGGFVGENRPQMSTSFDRADRQMLVIDVGEN